MEDSKTLEMWRSMNAKNEFQGPWPRVLCVCSAGLLRSPTLAWVLSNPPYNCNTRAAGSHPEYALVLVDQVLLNWANCVVFVDAWNRNRIMSRNLEVPGTVFVLDVPDSFEYRDPELIKVIRSELENVGFPEWSPLK